MASDSICSVALNAQHDPLKTQQQEFGLGLGEAECAISKGVARLPVALVLDGGLHIKILKTVTITITQVNFSDSYEASIKISLRTVSLPDQSTRPAAVLTGEAMTVFSALPRRLVTSDLSILASNSSWDMSIRWVMPWTALPPAFSSAALRSSMTFKFLMKLPKRSFSSSSVA